MIPRLQSDPGPSRLDPIWKLSFPPIPRPERLMLRQIPPLITPLRAPSMNSGNDSIISFGPFQAGVRSVGVGSDSIHFSDIHAPAPMTQISRIPASISVQSGSLGHIPKSGKRQRHCLIKVIMAPCDALEWALHKCFSPDENCSRCLKVMYWMVLIVGGIVSTVTALGPHMN
jgi:hypothetical protein